MSDDESPDAGQPLSIVESWRYWRLGVKGAREPRNS